MSLRPERHYCRNARNRMDTGPDDIVEGAQRHDGVTARGSVQHRPDDSSSPSQYRVVRIAIRSIIVGRFLIGNGTDRRDRNRPINSTGLLSTTHITIS
jgi:hypothetical protein